MQTTKKSADIYQVFVCVCVYIYVFIFPMYHLRTWCHTTIYCTKWRAARAKSVALRFCWVILAGVTHCMHHSKQL